MNLCTKCGYPVRAPMPAFKIKLDTSDPEVRRVFECAKRTAAEVAKWPAWKANECRCDVADVAKDTP